jgi:hypothetical protein
VRPRGLRFGHAEKLLELGEGSEEAVVGVGGEFAPGVRAVGDAEGEAAAGVAGGEEVGGRVAEVDDVADVLDAEEEHGAVDHVGGGAAAGDLVAGDGSLKGG